MPRTASSSKPLTAVLLDIQDLNSLIDAEPGSTLEVVP